MKTRCHLSSWHSEQAKLWRSKPRCPVGSILATFIKIISASHALQRIVRHRPHRDLQARIAAVWLKMSDAVPPPHPASGHVAAGPSLIVSCLERAAPKAMQELRRQQTTSPIKKPPGYEPGGGGCSGWRPARGASGGRHPINAGAVEWFRRGTEPMNKAARRLCRAALPWRAASPVLCDFTSFLSKLKPGRHRHERHKLFQVGSAQRGAPRRHVLAVRAPRHRIGLGLRGPVPSPGPA